ncbi:MAG: hypothetical protein J0M24_23965 [Verrucomicrobia bacterium]|nr:hypothetical protein [Verrucomicrobiota bacterium]
MNVIVYTVESHPWLAYVGLALATISFGIVFVYLLRAFATLKEVLGIVSSIKNAKSNAVLRYCTLRIGILIGFAASALIAGYFFSANAFLWFHGAGVGEKGVELFFLWPRPSSIVQKSEIRSVKVVALRRQSYLVIETKNGKVIRSVNSINSKLLGQLRAVLSEE